MLDNFIFAINAVMPLVIMMALGFFLRRANILQESFFRSCDKLVFHALLPAKLFISLYSVESIGEVDWSLCGFVVIAIVLLVAVSWSCTRFFVREKESRGAAVQCAFRSNTSLVGLPIAASLGGETAAAGMSAAIGVGVPLFNLFAVLVLSVENAQRADYKKVLKNIAKNPMIHGCLVGFAVLIIRGLLPKGADGAPVFSLKRDLAFVYSAVSSVGACASPIALLNIGGLMDFSRARKGLLGNIVYGCFWRMILAPVLVIGAAVGLTQAGIIDFTATDFAVLIPFFGSSVAVSSATMASEMGADADLARQYVLWTSILLAVTLPLIIVIMRSAGLL